MHVSYIVCAGLKNMHATYMQHTCNIDVSWSVSTCTLCATCVLYVLRACGMHVVYELLIHVAIFFALPYNYNIFMIRVCPAVYAQPSCHILGVGENQAVSW